MHMNRATPIHQHGTPFVSSVEYILHAHAGVSKSRSVHTIAECFVCMRFVYMVLVLLLLMIHSFILLCLLCIAPMLTLALYSSVFRCNVFVWKWRALYQCMLYDRVYICISILVG